MFYSILINNFRQTADPEVQQLMQQFAALREENRGLAFENEILAGEAQKVSIYAQMEQPFTDQLEKDYEFYLELEKQVDQSERNWYELKGKYESVDIGRQVRSVDLNREEVFFRNMQLLNERLEQKRKLSNEMENRHMVKELRKVEKDLAAAKAELDIMKCTAAAEEKNFKVNLENLQQNRNKHIVDLIQGGKELVALRNELSNISQQAAIESQATSPEQNNQESTNIAHNIVAPQSTKKSSWFNDEAIQRVRIPEPSDKDFFKFPTFRTFSANTTENPTKVEDLQYGQMDQSSSNGMHSPEVEMDKQTTENGPHTESQLTPNENKLHTAVTFVVPGAETTAAESMDLAAWPSKPETMNSGSESANACDLKLDSDDDFFTRGFPTAALDLEPSDKDFFKFPTFRTFSANTTENPTKVEDLQYGQMDQSSSNGMHSPDVEMDKQTTENGPHTESQLTPNEDKLHTAATFVVPGAETTAAESMDLAAWPSKPETMNSGTESASACDLKFDSDDDFFTRGFPTAALDLEPSDKDFFKFPTFRTFSANTTENPTKVEDLQYGQMDQSSSNGMHSPDVEMDKQTTENGPHTESQLTPNEDKLHTAATFVVPGAETTAADSMDLAAWPSKPETMNSGSESASACDLKFDSDDDFFTRRFPTAALDFTF